MNLVLLNKNFEVITPVEVFSSIIWTERYSSAGDFELIIPASVGILAERDFYIYSKESKKVMIIDSIENKEDLESLDILTFSGKSLENILSRRIVWKQTILNGDLQNGIEKLLNENVISPEIVDRKIPNFVFERSSDSYINSLKIRSQYTGDNLYDVIVEICDSFGLGFEVRLSEDNKFVFKLYNGVNRSYDQDANPYVIFSPRFDNLTESNYVLSNSNYKNVALIAGEDEGTERRTRTIGAGSGLGRRELYVDARDIQSELSDGTTLSDEEYNAQLDQRGEEKLSAYKNDGVFDGELDIQTEYVYGRDFYNGDIVQVQTRYGLEKKARITEYIKSQDVTGYTAYPSFSIID